MTEPDYAGHSPATCKYFECKGDPKTVCPFLADQNPELDVKELRRRLPRSINESDCKHEWRQYWIPEHGKALPAGFFCIHCKMID